VLGGLQQVLGLADAGPVEPLQRGGAGLAAEAPDQGAGAGSAPRGDVVQGEVAGRAGRLPASKVTGERAAAEQPA
jgi:hypothetical protein